MCEKMTARKNHRNFKTQTPSNYLRHTTQYREVYVRFSENTTDLTVYNCKKPIVLRYFDANGNIKETLIDPLGK